MLVSVVIPTYNRAGMVGRAVASVLKQTHRDLECLVVDDGSSDDTPAVLAAMADPRLKVTRQDNRGVSAARNAGLALARGDYLALLDSDDHFLPTKIERQLAFMRAHGYAICQTQEIWMRGGRRVNPMAKHAKADGDFFERALSICLVSPSCVMFTRAFLDEVGGFDETLPACEDYDLWLRTLPRHEVGLLDEALTVKEGGRQDQLSHMMVGQDLFRVRALLKLLGRDDLPHERRVQTARAIEEKARIYRRGCVLHGKPEEAQRVGDMVEQALALALANIAPKG
ncbi:glycosyltransferase [Fundidesulfovibrio butyratiphilus]